MNDSVDYHLGELSIARDHSHAAHGAPTIAAHHKKILDIGCGMGQTLIALDLPMDVEAYGIDPDETAIEAGREMVAPNIHLSAGSGESLPFADDFFDLVICRVALPYMHVGKALAEMHRVLRPGGDVWLMMHPVEMYTHRARRSMRTGRVKDAIYCGYILLNGLLFSYTGKQVKFGSRMESCQTEFGMRRALGRLGFESVRVERERFFVAQGSKRAS
jgi:SAM-dependent methyltransferase